MLDMLMITTPHRMPLPLGLITCLLVLYSVSACAPQPSVIHLASSSSPRPLSPLTGSFFVEADLLLQWEGSLANANQVYAVQVRLEGEDYREAWTKETQFSAQALIDSYSQAVGTYYWKVAVLNLDEQGVLQNVASDWSAEQSLYRVRRLPIAALAPDQQSEAARYIAQNASTPREIIDFTRHFVHTHSNITEQASYAPDYSDALAQMMSFMQGESEAPNLYCDGLTTSMLTVLAELGIESRLIFLYGLIPGFIAQHTVIEIFNPETQAWEVHDPLFNLMLWDSESGQPASIERAVFGAWQTLEACDAQGICAYDNLSPVAQYYGAFRYGYSDTFWVNPDRFDISQRIEAHGNRNLAELLTGNPRDFSFRFDSWTQGN